MVVFIIIIIFLLPAQNRKQIVKGGGIRSLISLILPPIELARAPTLSQLTSPPTINSDGSERKPATWLDAKLTRKVANAVANLLIEREFILWTHTRY
jgi:hypothetical protein